MGSTQATRHPASEEGLHDFWPKLRGLRRGLAPTQREALDVIVANAAKALALANATAASRARGAATEQASEAMEFVTALTSFRDELAPHERDAFDALVIAGAAQGAANGDGVAYNLVIILVAIGVGVPAGTARPLPRERRRRTAPRALA